MQYTITKNEKFNSLEVLFSEKPGEAIRNALKALKFRWNGAKGIWYGYAEESALRSVLTRESSPADVAKTKNSKPKEKVNKYGVKVGDFFSMSWGYEQTNVDFFQVIALVGEQSVRLRHVCPEMIKEEPTGGMSARRTYNLDRSHILPTPTTQYCVFINDQEKGDVKRVQEIFGDIWIKMTSYASARLVKDDVATYDESWYG